ncbi:MAG: carbohydrate kinase family protein [Patescibacteria group bacterium]|jgi:sugar/nucleoside kinase (ribokinase family)
MIYDFITIGGTTRDISFFTDQGVLINNYRDILRQKVLAFESGAKIKVDKFYYSYGGGAANTAVCLANLGFKTACLTSVGNDEDGQLIVKNLRKRQVSTRLIQRIKDADSGASFILISPTGERIIFAQRGANNKLHINANQLAVLRRTRNIYIASLAGNWAGELKKIFSLVGASGPRIFWNPGMTQYLQGVKKIAPYLKKVSVLASNKDEAIELVMTSSSHRHLGHKFLNNPENLIKIMHSFGPQVVVITLGSAGVIAYDGQKIYHRAIINGRKPVDTTGVGDIFNSSFAAGMVLFTNDINKSLELGLLNTAAKVAHIGAQNGLMKYR